VTAQAPFDLILALRDPAYLRGALQRPLKGDLAVTRLPRQRRARSGLLPPGSSGTVSLSARLSGSVVDPNVEVNTAGEDVTVGALHGLAFQGTLGIGNKLKATLGAESQGDVVARLDASASVSGAELVELLERRSDREVIAPLLDRAVAFTLEIPGLTIARASQLAGRTAVAEGRVVGRVALSGTPARPQLTGQLTLRDVTAQANKLGAADLYLE